MRRLTLLLSLPAMLLATEPMTQEVSIPTSDGYVLSGTFTVPAGSGKRPVVILAHSFQASRSNWGPLVDRLSTRGVASLALDLRGHGRNMEQPGSADLDKVPSDLVAAAAWVRKQSGINSRRVGLGGSGEGAFAAILAAPMIKPDTLLALSISGGDFFGQDARKRMVTSLAKSRAALMAFVSTDDKESDGNAEPLRPIYGTNIRTFEGGRRGFEFLENHTDTMAVFFAEYLLYPHKGGGMATTPAPNPSTATVPTDQPKP